MPNGSRQWYGRRGVVEAEKLEAMQMHEKRGVQGGIYSNRLIFTL